MGGWVVGIDLGATKTALGLVDAAGTIVAKGATVQLIVSSGPPATSSTTTSSSTTTTTASTTTTS